MAKKLVYTTNTAGATTDYAAADGTWKTIPGGGGGGSGTVTSVATTAPITGGTITTSGTIGITQASGSTDGYLSSANWNTFNNKQNAITVTNTGTSGAATLVGSTLNIPLYAGAGSGVSFIGGTIGNGTGVVPGLTTQYVGLAGASNVNAETTREMILPQDCTLSRMYFRIGTIQPITGSLILTLRKNGADTALTITVAAGSAVGTVVSNIVNSISYNAGDVAAIKFVNNAGANSARLELITIMVTI